MGYVYDPATGTLIESAGESLIGEGFEYSNSPEAVSLGVDLDGPPPDPNDPSTLHIADEEETVGDPEPWPWEDSDWVPDPLEAGLSALAGGVSHMQETSTEAVQSLGSAVGEGIRGGLADSSSELARQGRNTVLITVLGLPVVVFGLYLAYDQMKKRGVL